MTKFVLDKPNRIVFVEFDEPNLNKSNAIERLDIIESGLYELSEEGDIDFLVFKIARDNYQLDSLNMIYEHLDVRVISKWEKIILAIERMQKITIAALQGQVSGAGIQLSLVCDYHICLTDTTFNFSAIKLGFLPGMALFRLAKYIGLGKAKKMLITGNIIDAKCAVDWGLCDEIADDLDFAVQNFLVGIQPIQIEPTIMARLLLNNSYHDSYEDEIGDYLAAQSRCFEKIKGKTK